MQARGEGEDVITKPGRAGVSAKQTGSDDKAIQLESPW